MDLVKLLPVILCIATLAAHYYRAGLVSLVFVFSGSLLVLFVKKKWSVRLVQTLLLIGGVEWIRTCINLVLLRQSMGVSWSRLALILGLVAALSFLSVFLFRIKSLRARYGLDDSE